MGLNWAKLGEAVGDVANVVTSVKSGLKIGAASIANTVDEVAMEATNTVGKTVGAAKDTVGKTVGAAKDTVNKAVDDISAGYSTKREMAWKQTYQDARLNSPRIQKEIQSGKRNADGTKVSKVKEARQSTTNNDVVNDAINIDASAKESKKKAKQAKQQQETATTTTNTSTSTTNTATATSTSSSSDNLLDEDVMDINEENVKSGAGFWSGLGGVISNHPYIAAGIAGGVGVAGGALLFGDDDDY